MRPAEGAPRLATRGRLPGAAGVPDYVGLHLRVRRWRRADSVRPSTYCTVMARISARCSFGERRRRLQRLVSRSRVPCLRLVEAFAR
jgi:hypothetical protein